MQVKYSKKRTNGTTMRRQPNCVSISSPSSKTRQPLWFSLIILGLLRNCYSSKVNPDSVVNDDSIETCKVSASISVPEFPLLDDSVSDLENVSSEINCIDDEEYNRQCEERGESHCNIDPTFMLIHCRKTCSICVPQYNYRKDEHKGKENENMDTNREGVVQQDVGFGTLPMHITIEILQIVRETNLYYLRTQKKNNLEQNNNSKYRFAANYQDNTKTILEDNIQNNLVEPCRDAHPLCAFWKFHGHCSSSLSSSSTTFQSQYEAFMEQACPLTCQLCDYLQGQSFLSFLLFDMNAVYYNDDSFIDPNRKKSNDENKSRSNQNIRAPKQGQQTEQGELVVASRRRSLSLLLTKLGMDPLVLTYLWKPSDGNWLLNLHRRLHESIPPALLRLYSKQQLQQRLTQGDIDQNSSHADITSHELFWLLKLHGIKSKRTKDFDDIQQTLERISAPYRGRGYILRSMEALDHFVTRPIQLNIGFAVPTFEALQTIVEQGPIVQMGAGTGYWAALLMNHYSVTTTTTLDVDFVVAYDIRPPNVQDNAEQEDHDDEAGNAFFQTAFFDSILQGACVDVFQSQPMLAQERTLLLIWPNDPDPVDNIQFCIGTEDCKKSEPVWDADCLLAYLTAGGQRVIYVGERETELTHWIPYTLPDAGISSSRIFQNILAQQFRLVTRVTLPQWWLNEDDMTVWELQQPHKHQLQ